MAQAVALAALLTGGNLHAEAASVEIRGSELVVSTEGRPLARTELIGALLAFAQEDGLVVDVRIDRIATDPRRSEGLHPDDPCGLLRRRPPTTLNGMLINFYDTLGIQQRDGALGSVFEAAWDAQGALCVARPRVPQNITLEGLATACPQLAGHLGPSCTEVAAMRLGTPLLYNASRGDGVHEQDR